MSEENFNINNNSFDYYRKRITEKFIKDFQEIIEKKIERESNTLTISEIKCDCEDCISLKNKAKYLEKCFII